MYMQNNSDATNNVRHLLGYLVSYKLQIAIVFTALVLVSLSLLCLGSVFRHLVDHSIGDRNSHSINYSIGLISGLIAVFAIGSFVRSFFINLTSEKVVAQIKKETYKNLMTIEISAFEELKIGDILSRLNSDLEIVGNFITSFLSFFIRNTIMLFGAIILMFFQSPKLSALVIITIPLFLIPVLRLGKHVRALSRKVMNEYSAISSYIEESFSGIRILHAFNQQQNAVSYFSSKIEHYLKHVKHRLKYRSMFFALAITVISGAITIVIWIGSLDIADGKISSGQMISFIYYAVVAGMSAGGIAELFSELQNPLAAIDRVFELKNRYDTVTNFAEERELNFSDSSFEFANVTFYYPSRPSINAIEDISFKIESGEFIGIVGKSGSGKSTIMQLLLGFYHYQAGYIKIGGYDLNSVPVGEVRKIIAYTPQDPSIFSGTIRYNILFSNPEASEDKFEEVLKICGIDKIIANLPDGIHTEIGEKGVRLSGGQKQRIAIARSLIYQPQILLLDEATSALDSESENQLLKNVREFMRDKTIISIAHRLGSLKEADRILVIEVGKLAAMGRHDELALNNKVYQQMLKKARA